MTRILVRRIFVVRDELRERAERWRREHFARPARKRQEEYIDLLDCPLCGRRMFRRFHSAQYFIEVDRCFHCKCTWYDGAELELLQALVESATDRMIEDRAP